MKELELSTLNKTWLFDIDGTLVKHNGYKTDGYDTFLPGALEYVKGISAKDHIVLLTSRTEEYRQQTEKFLRDNGVRYDEIIFNLPYGERILVNDRKPSGLNMSIGINLDRDKFEVPEIIEKL